MPKKRLSGILIGMEHISKEGLVQLKKELEKRKTDGRREIAERLEEARSMGDLSENSEYDAAKNAQSFNEGKIAELEEALKNAVLIEPSKGQPSEGKKVQVGSVVKALMTNSTAEERIFAIVGSREADPVQGKISNESPLGQAFLGRQIGDTIEVETPNGKVEYKITRIE